MKKISRPATVPSPTVIKSARGSSLFSLSVEKWLLLFFIVTRVLTWVFAPPDFSEVIYSYMPYAHLWASGTRPYLDQWYEYPPATIPLFYVPHVIDMATRYWPLHFNYSHSYRGSLLLIDVLLFWLVWKTLKKDKVSSSVLAGAVVYYSLITLRASHFIYDTMDWSFAAAMSLGAVAPVLWPHAGGTFLEWVGFFLATALKYINAPLLAVYGMLELPPLTLKPDPMTAIKKHIFSLPWMKLLLKGMLAGMAFVVVWGLPLVLYRSSLSVSFVYHQLRGLQIDSTAAVIVRTIDSFTKSEKVIEVYKNYEIAGPLTNTALAITNTVFILSIGLFLVFSCLASWLRGEKTADFYRLWFTLGYILVFTLSGKVLSRPFLLWHIPLIALLPFKDLKTQLSFTLPSYVLIFTSYALVPNWHVGPFTLPLMVGWLRVLILLYLLGRWVQLSWRSPERTFQTY